MGEREHAFYVKSHTPQTNKILLRSLMNIYIPVEVHMSSVRP